MILSFCYTKMKVYLEVSFIFFDKTKLRLLISDKIFSEFVTLEYLNDLMLELDKNKKVKNSVK